MMAGPPVCQVSVLMMELAGMVRRVVMASPAT